MKMKVSPEQIEKNPPPLNYTSPPENETVEVDDVIDEGSLTRSDPAIHGLDEPLERGVVERGHTIHAPLANQRRVVGWMDGKRVFGPVNKSFGPGQEVLLPRSEVKRLRETGHLIDPNKKVDLIQEPLEPKPKVIDTRVGATIHDDN
jgi:hypothetical protein